MLLFSFPFCRKILMNGSEASSRRAALRRLVPVFFPIILLSFLYELGGLIPPELPRIINSGRSQIVSDLAGGSSSSRREAIS